MAIVKRWKSKNMSMFERPQPNSPSNMHSFLIFCINPKYCETYERAMRPNIDYNCLCKLINMSKQNKNV